MTKNRNLKRRIRARASKTGESYSSARRHVLPPTGPVSIFEGERPADYLLRAAASAAGQAYKALAIEQLAVQPGDTVLDLGCGTGGELEPLLRSLGPGGSLIGVDTDENALRAARERFADPRLRLLTGDAHALHFGDDAVDRVYVDRTAQHLAAPATALDGLRRILRPGGRVVLAEPDWQTLLVDSPEPELAEAYRRFVIDRLIRNPRIGSELPRLVQDAGLRLDTVIPVTATYTDPVEGDRIFGFARVTRRSVAAGYLDQAQADRWLQHLAGRTFFASLTIFITVARRPSVPLC
ncbi:methyltransferase domain-containing protein [Leifsonia shinshuensis]|uniref:methyltransferase domain-containing protein n=1 Tax=Leifsonia shinshuensis TaxID=150026 RepID=UPI001F50AB95|nr:methyltransferase domain-containing protein [Leifsonia shinshuensis]MCI0159398.1 methyltransferase domain-containing protein [Leifsonia shinshuensis]